MSGKTIDKKLLAGVGISLCFMVLLFRKIDFDKVLLAFRAMDYRYLLPVVFLTFVSYYLRAVRWKYLLLPIKRTAMANLFPATIIGYMANNILPARLGEFVRAYVLGQKEEIETSAVFATLVVDRLFDGFTVLLILLITFFTVKLPAGMENVQDGLKMGGYVTLGVYLVVLSFLFLLKKRTMRTIHVVGVLLRPFPVKVSEKVIPLLGSFISGIRLSSRPSEILILLFTSFAVWATCIWPLHLILQSFNITLPITASMLIMVFLVFAVMVPASPGYVGTYHAACVYGLMAFNIPKEQSLSVALVMHGTGFFPVIVAGFYYLWRDKVSLKKISENSGQRRN
ncbi:lysylphosphatidylglycerol synthase transmembrane domain-containing protein [Geotalea toluenoxydans]|uniref:lysylphosphatidylglycerol synthase transmembrane domain-containing protein n=1 Tax=Geotalea toluenoxydans TaxID=421624 RepID=UPI000AEF0CD4|nr:lysylphosphatidylglycerol synthase transmembrane domain-containing protein [Geotalea toluenoxydans]